MKKYNLTIGLNDKDTKMQKYDDITAYKMVEDILKQYLDGYTILKAFGGYKHDNGTFVQENSLRVEIMFATDLQVKLIVNQIKEKLNQESVAVESVETNSQLW